MEAGYPWHVCAVKNGDFYTVRTCWVCEATLKVIPSHEEYDEGSLKEFEEWHELRDIIEQEGVLYAFNQIKKENENGS
jgi:hypothetical protein